MKDKPTPAAILRQKAEELLKNKSAIVNEEKSDIEILKLIHELDVHQIELEMQNEELLLAKINAETETQKYTNLYDFAPSGYFTLSREGKIMELNFIGANLLGKERSLLLNKRFALYVSDKSRPTFTVFLEELFKNKTRQTCEIMLSTNSEIPTFINLTGIIDDDNDQCLITMVDISQRKKTEEDFIQSQLLLQSTIESQNETIIFSIDTNYNYLTFNKAHSDAMKLAYNTTIKVGMNVLECMSSIIEDRKIAKENFDRALRGESHSNIRVFGDVEKASYESFFNPIVDNNNKVIGATGLARNITKRIQDEENLKISEEKYRILFETNRDSITIFRINSDGKPGHFIETNPAATALFGYTKQELLAMNILDIEIVSDEIRKERLALLQNNGKIDFETTIKNKKGNLVNVEKECVRINYLNEPAIMHITRDITVRKQIEENTRKAQENLITVLEAIPDILFEVDSTGKIKYYQSHLEESLTVQDSAFIGKNLQEVMPAYAAKVCFDALQEANTYGSSSGKQYELNLGQGKYWFELSVSPIKEGNIPNKHYIVLASNITKRKVAEEKLRVEQERIRTILELVGNPIFLKDNEHRVTFANSAFCALFGLEEKNIIGKTLAENVPENEQEHFLRIDRKVLDTGVTDVREQTLTVKGVEHTIITSKTRLIDAAGNKSLVGSIYDITDRKKAEEALQKSQEKLRGVFDLANSGIILTDLRGKYLLFNNWCTKALGYTRTELNKLTTDDLTHPDDIEISDLTFKKLVEGKIDRYKIEKRFVRKDKSYFWAEVSVSAIKDKNNKVVNTIGILNDITEKRNAKIALQESEIRLIEAQSFAKVGSWQIDLNTHGILWTEENYKIFGIDFSAGKPTLENFMAIVHPKDRNLVKTKFLHSLKNYLLNTFEHRIITPAGVEKTIEARWKIIRNEQGEPSIVSGTCQDITERKSAEKALENEKRRLAVILVGTGAGTWEWNIQTGLIIFNEKWAEILGYTLDELAPVSFATWEKLTHADDLKYTKEKIEKHIQGILDYYESEFRMKHKNGDWVWILSRGKINEWDLDGKPLYMSGTHQDITDRKLAEQKLIASEKLLNETQFIANIGSYSLDFNSGKWNSTAALDCIFGIDPNFEKTIEGWIRIIHPEWQMVIWEYLNNEVITKKTVFNKEYKIIKIDTQEERWVHGNGEIIYNKQGQLQQLIGSIQDITERKLVEEELKKASEKLKDLVNSTEGIVWEADALTFNFTYVSEQAERLFGFAVKDWYTDGFWKNHLHPEDKEKAISFCTSQTKKMVTHDFTYRFICKNGNIIWLRDIINVIIEEGKPRWLRGVMFDITHLKENEISLRESEEKYRALVENSPDGVVIYVEEKIAFINNEGLRMVGLKSKEEMIGKSVFQFIHPDSLSNIMKKMEEVVLNKNVSETIEEKFIDINGVPFDVELKAIPTLYEHKNAVQIIIHDITKRKQDALELNKINRVYALISQINNLILRTHNRQELFQEICNIAVHFGKFHMSWVGLLNDNHKIITAAFAGHEEGYFTKSNITTVLDVPEGRGPTGIAMREGRSVICNDIANDPMMKPWRKDALERGYSSVISIPIIVRNTKIGVFNLYSQETNFFSSEEEISLLEKIILNIAFKLESILVEEDRKQTEEKIRQLSQAVEQSPVTIVISNINGDIEYVNSKFIETTGYTLEEVIGKNPRVLKSGYTSPKEYQELWETLAAGKEWHGEFHNKRKDGSLFWESATISPILNAEGKITHYIAIKEDITHRKKVEKELVKSKERAEESDRLKLVFLANMSHEIRTPMNGILGFTELLKEPKLSGDEQQEYISIIEKSGKRMLNIINDIISISKVESGQIEISQTDTNVNEQIEYIHTFFQPEAKQKGIQLTILKKLAAKDNLIKTDQEKVYAVLTNLVKNALKFTNEGAIEIGCEKKGGYLEFFVKDTGLGISKSQKKIIFERFRQANETISRTHEGSGLGLAISKAYVEMLDGRIWVESQEGKGSTFYFTIPFHSQIIAEENTGLEKAPTIAKEENKVKDLKVLIVEDDAISKLLITIAVKPYSKEILKVSTGIEAIEACRNNPDIDLVMMDINMPEMGGYEATKNIRGFNKDLIIIAQTANGMQSDRDNAIAAGCTDYISKPINIIDLGALIQKYFK